MGLDFDALVLGPNYAIMGVAATYTPSGGSAAAITVIDFTRGEVIHEASADGLAVAKPTVHARKGDIDDPAEGGTIVVNGHTYRIDASLPAPGPGGIDVGEVILVLELQS